MSLPALNICTKAHDQEQKQTISTRITIKILINPYPNIGQGPYCTLACTQTYKTVQTNSITINQQAPNSLHLAGSTIQQALRLLFFRRCGYIPLLTRWPLRLGTSSSPLDALSMREHRLKSAFKGDQWSPPGVPSSRGTRLRKGTTQGSLSTA